MSLRQRNKRRNKILKSSAKPIFNGCDNCGYEKISSSPTGDWCNNCGRQWPCPCDAKDCEGCFNHLLKKAAGNNLKTPKSCCCGVYMRVSTNV